MGYLNTMETNEIIRKIAYVIVIAFMLIGIYFTEIFLHEMVHVNDLKEFRNNDSRVYLFVFSPDFSRIIPGVYDPGYNYLTQEDIIKMESKRTYTEIRAYRLQILFFVICAYLFWIFLKERQTLFLQISKKMELNILKEKLYGRPYN